jgi:hypothetical protein
MVDFRFGEAIVATSTTWRGRWSSVAWVASSACLEEFHHSFGVGEKATKRPSFKEIYLLFAIVELHETDADGKNRSITGARWDGKIVLVSIN